MNDCSTCNSSLSDICHYVKITCSIKFQRSGLRLFMVLRAGAHHSLRSYVVLRGEMTFITRCPGGKKPKDKYLLLAECEVRTASYGTSFFLPFMAQAQSTRAMKTRKEKTRIHNLPYGPSRRG